MRTTATRILLFLALITSALAQDKVDLAKQVQGLLPPANGGCGTNNPTAHGILVAEGASACTPITPGNSGAPLLSGSSADPAFGALNLAGGSNIVSGVLPALNLPTGTVLAVTNDTNIHGSISAQNLTFSWSGTLAKNRNLATAVYNDQSNTFSTGTQDFSAVTTFRPKFGTTASIPATCAVGDIYEATDATPGQNWYFCTATNTWTQQLNSAISGYTNVLNGTGVDPCAQMVSLASGSFQSFAWPLSGAQNCSVDPMAAINTTGGVLQIIPQGSGGVGATISIDVPWDFKYPSMVAFAPPNRGATGSSGSTGVRLKASANFASLAANRIFTNSGSPITIAAEGTDANCYNVTYTTSGPPTAYGIRAGELVQLIGFTNSGTNDIYRVATSASTACPNGYASSPGMSSSTVIFTIYAPNAATCTGSGGSSCGTGAEVIAPTYMIYLGPKPTDLGTNGSACLSYNGVPNSTCVHTGSPGNYYSFSDVIRDIGLTANGYPGIGGVFTMFADEGSGYLNDTSTVVRTPFPAFVTSSGTGGQSQNNSGVSFIEYYCNGVSEDGGTCQNAGGNNVNGSNPASIVGVWGFDIFTKQLVDTATLIAPGQCAVAVDAMAPAGSGIAKIDRIHPQLFQHGVCIGRGEANPGSVLINGVQMNNGSGPTLPDVVHIYHNFSDTPNVSVNGISQTGVTTTIQNDFTGNSWNDNTIAWYVMSRNNSQTFECSSSNAIACSIPSISVTTLPLNQISNPLADKTFTFPFSSTTGLTITGNAPNITSGAGTNAGSLFNITGATGGATSGATSTAGTGSSPTITGGLGGAGTGTNAVGGAGGSTTIGGGNGGASNGTGVNSAGGDVILAPGAPGTGGSGTVGRAGQVQMTFGTLGGNLTNSFFKTTGTWNTTGNVDAAWFLNIINTASGANSKLLDLQIANSTLFNVDKLGDVNQQGIIKTYNGNSTVDLGVPSILGSIDQTGVSSANSGSPQNILASTPAAGHYRVGIYVDESAGCATVGSGALTVVLGWTDATHARVGATLTLTPGTAATGTGSFVSATQDLWAAASSAITVTDTFVACNTGSWTYDQHGFVEEIK